MSIINNRLYIPCCLYIEIISIGSWMYRQTKPFSCKTFFKTKVISGSSSIIRIFSFLICLFYRYNQSNSANNRLTNLSIVTGFWIKHPKLNFGYTSLRASKFVSAADIKHTLMFGSTFNSFSQNWKPLISGMYTSTSIRS